MRDTQKEEFIIDKHRIRRMLIKSLQKSAYQYRIQLPFVSDPIFSKSNKRKMTWNLYDLSCIDYCIHKNFCQIYPQRINNGKHIACWNFESKEINLQVCEKCNSVRFAESEKKITGICEVCRNKQSLENSDSETHKFITNKQAYEEYKKAKERKIKELEKLNE